VLLSGDSPWDLYVPGLQTDKALGKDHGAAGAHFRGWPWACHRKTGSAHGQGMSTVMEIKQAVSKLPARKKLTVAGILVEPMAWNPRETARQCADVTAVRSNCCGTESSLESAGCRFCPPSPP